MAVPSQYDHWMQPRPGQFSHQSRDNTAQRSSVMSKVQPIQEALQAQLHERALRLHPLDSFLRLYDISKFNELDDSNVDFESAYSKK